MIWVRKENLQRFRADTKDMAGLSSGTTTRRADIPVERRAFSRLDVPGTATVDTGSGGFSARVENLSLHGAFLATDEVLSVGTVVSITLSLPELPPELGLELTGQVARLELGGLAVDFKNMSGPAFNLLRRVLETEHPDPDRVEAELKAYLQSLNNSAY